MTRDGPVRGCAVDFDRFHEGGLGAGHGEDGVADLDAAGVEAPGY